MDIREGSHLFPSFRDMKRVKPAGTQDQRDRRGSSTLPGDSYVLLPAAALTAGLTVLSSGFSLPIPLLGKTPTYDGSSVYLQHPEKVL